MEGLIAHNLQEGTRTEWSVFTTKTGVVFLEFKRGSQVFRTALPIEQSKRLAGSIKRAADYEEIQILRKLGHHVGPL